MVSAARSRPAQFREGVGQTLDGFLHKSGAGDRSHGGGQIPLFEILGGQFQPDFGLTSAARLSSLIGGMRHDDLRDAVYDGSVGRAHPAVMQDHLEVGEDVIKIDPGQKARSGRQLSV